MSLVVQGLSSNRISPLYEDHQFRRLDAKRASPGSGGLAAAAKCSIREDVIYLDRQYIEHWSFWLDLVSFSERPRMLRRTGAF